MPLARAPLVVKLFGEHAVVYGYHALAAALNLKVEVKVEPSSSREYVIESALGVERLRDIRADSPRHRYIVQSLRVVSSDILGRDIEPVKITVNSPVPPSCGLATSAAVTAATLAALLKYLNIKVDRAYLAELSHKVEVLVQGRASPMDTYTSVMGGLVLIYPRGGEISRLSLTPRVDLSLVLVQRVKTTKDLVAHVYAMYTRYREIVEKIFELIDEICLKSLNALTKLNIDELGMLMYVNHNLLSALGVSNHYVDSLISYFRQSGVLGAKMSGAGDGGTIVILGKISEDLERKAREILRDRYLAYISSVCIDYSGIEIAR